MFIPQGAIIRRVEIFHDEDGTFLRAIRFYDKSDTLLLQSGHVRGVCKEVNLSANERLVGFRSYLAPDHGGECAHFNF